jgi:transposase
MPKKIDAAVKERALRMFAEHRHDDLSDTALAEAVATKVGRETALRWLVQSDVNAGSRPGTRSDEQAEIKKLKAENKRLREDNETLRAATVFFAGELCATRRWVYREVVRDRLPWAVAAA